jgi:hypothetical protein
MSIFRHVGICFLLLAAARLPQSHPALSQSAPAASQSSQLRDDQHDFDFDFGTGKTHPSRLQHPLSGSTAWTEWDGVSVAQKVWDGRSHLAVLESDGAAGHLELLALRLYDPQAHPWPFSADGGKTREPNWINTYTRVPSTNDEKDGSGKER